MAQFRELMKQAERMCKAHIECSDCPINEYVDIYGGCPFSGDLDSENVENAILNWAMQHPEKPKVYPTWKEYLRQIGVIKPCEAPCDSSAVYRNILNDINGLNKRIPEDMAEKLGVKPVGVEE